MKHNSINLLILMLVIGIVGLACSTASNDQNSAKPAANAAKSPGSPAPAKLESYSIKGVKFAYFKIASGLKKQELIETAQKLHEQEPDTQLVLIDDDSKLADYVSYVKAISGQGEIDKPLPSDWADKHIIANVQKYMSGKFVLCEGNGSAEIAELK